MRHDKLTPEFLMFILRGYSSDDDGVNQSVMSAVISSSRRRKGNNVD
ncbi:hypothetical protein SUS17_1319 [Sphingomonas sp. S17]|nr:hypothetical protein SUS17_1319 [Sphingomonas sp. S17]